MADETENNRVTFENHAVRYANGAAVVVGTLLCCVEEGHPLNNTRLTYLGSMRVDDRGPDTRPERHLAFRIEGGDGAPRRFDPAELPALEVVERP